MHLLAEVYRRLGAIHATLAETDQVDEGLHHRTLDRLMDVLGTIESAPTAARNGTELARPELLTLLFCDTVTVDDGGVITAWRVYNELIVKEFPTAQRVAIFAQVADVLDGAQFSLRAIHRESKRTVGVWSRAILTHSGRIANVTDAENVILPIEAPGSYEFNAEVDGVTIGTRVFAVRRFDSYPS